MIQALRVSLFITVILLIHLQYAQLSARRQSQPLAPVDLDQLRRLFPTVESIADEVQDRGRRNVLGAAGESLGYVLLTSPGSDHLIGFSGPTNTLIAFDNNNRILGITILSSMDTKEHVDQVHRDEAFMHSFDGLSWEKAAVPPNVDSVSGATLTSLAIRESIIYRLSGGRPSLRFPDPLTVADACKLFASADSVEQDAAHSSLWHIKGERGEQIGSILRTSPHADNVVGYQGPTETFIGFGTDGRVIGILLGRSYDNQPYVSYVREDEYFLTLFNDLVLEELARLDLEEAEVEGVSGATMTSMAVAKGLLLASERHRQASSVPAPPPKSPFLWTLRDLGTAAVILAGLTISMTRIRRMRFLRLGYQLVLIGYLGLVNGDMLSQAMIVGWAQNGVPWRSAGGLVLLTAAAFLVPITTKRNAYCTHLCPHGAVQQLVKNRLRWRLRVRPRLSRVLRLVPWVLLGWCVIVGMLLLPFSLVDIEPFDAWVFRVAGWSTMAIAIVGLVASLFTPMAYCRYGCPTGALLGYLRFSSHSDRWSPRDWLAVALVAMALGLWIASSMGQRYFLPVG